MQRMIAAEEDQGEVRLSEEVDDIDEWVKSWPVPPDRAFTLPQLLRLAGLAGVVSSGPPPGIEVSGLACDSRRVKEGDLFVCVAGAKADGHDFAASAVKAGAVAVVAAASDLKLDRAPPGVRVRCLWLLRSSILGFLPSASPFAYRHRQLPLPLPCSR